METYDRSELINRLTASTVYYMIQLHKLLTTLYHSNVVEGRPLLYAISSTLFK